MLFFKGRILIVKLSHFFGPSYRFRRADEGFGFIAAFGLVAAFGFYPRWRLLVIFPHSKEFLDLGVRYTYCWFVVHNWLPHTYPYQVICSVVTLEPAVARDTEQFNRSHIWKAVQCAVAFQDIFLFHLHDLYNCKGCSATGAYKQLLVAAFLYHRFIGNKNVLTFQPVV